MPATETTDLPELTPERVKEVCVQWINNGNACSEGIYQFYEKVGIPIERNVVSYVRFGGGKSTLSTGEFEGLRAAFLEHMGAAFKEFFDAHEGMTVAEQTSVADWYVQS